MNDNYISMNPNQQRRHISREFKKRGLSLQPAALSGIQNILHREHMNHNSNHNNTSESSSRFRRSTSSSSSSSSLIYSSNNTRKNITKEVLQTLLDEIKKRMMNDGRTNGKTSSSGTTGDGNTSSHTRISATAYGSTVGGSTVIVTQEILQNVVAELTRDGNDVLDEAMQLLNAWKMNRLEYNVMNKRWKLLDGSQEVTGGDGSSGSISRSSGNDHDRNGSQGGNNSGRSVFGQPSDKVNMLLQRYYFIQQRILRQEIFQNKLSINNYSSSTSSNMLRNEQHKLTPIEGLLGTTDTKTLLGIIIQMEQNQYYLEDPTSSIPIDLSQVNHPSTDGFITEYSIVLVEGHMSDDGEMLIVQTIGHPMYESRNDAIENIGLQNSNIFDTIPNLNELERLQSEELEHGFNGMFVLLSDVHLDDINVLEKLEVLFQGFDGSSSSSSSNDNEGNDHQDDEEMYDNESFPLPVFVLMGDFASNYPSSIGSGDTIGGKSTVSYKSSMMGLFDELANVIAKFPRIAQEGRFVLIPSMNDVGMGSILPRPPLPKYFLKGLQSKVRHVHLASNPCRLRYFSKEIVLSRFDLLSKLRRNAILPPKNASRDNDDDDDESMMEEEEEEATTTNKNRTTMDDLIQHSIKTILDQGHLCPVPLHTTPIYWQYDHAMRLYPPPDILVLSESTTKRYSEKYHDVEVMNPGPFNVNYEFLVIKPCDVTEDGDEIFVNVEFSQVS